MPMKTLTTLFLSSLLLIAALPSYTQDFLITAKGDTLKGQVKMLVNGYDKRVQVIQADKKKNTFSIVQVRGFMIDQEYFQPVKFGETYTFMKQLKDGYLSLFAYQLDKQLTYEGRYLLKKHGVGMEVPNLAFKKNMIKFLEDCPQVTNQIEQGQFKYHDLEAIIDAYNLCIDSRSKSLSNEIAKQSLNQALTSPWTELQEKVQASSLDNKSDLIDMIIDIKAKVSRGEKIPKFLTDALKSGLETNTDLTETLNQVLSKQNQ